MGDRWEEGRRDQGHQAALAQHYHRLRSPLSNKPIKVSKQNEGAIATVSSAGHPFLIEASSILPEPAFPSLLKQASHLEGVRGDDGSGVEFHSSHIRGAVRGVAP